MLVRLPSNGPLDGWVRATEILWIGLEEIGPDTPFGASRYFPAARFSWRESSVNLTFRPMSEAEAKVVVDEIAEASNAQ